jgi:hypothetical protein
MRTTVRNGALALCLIAGTAFIAAPTTPAQAMQKNGYFGLLGADGSQQ